MSTQRPTAEAPITDPGHPRIRVLVVDDHEMVADALTRVLSAEPDLEVVGIARNVAEVRASHARADVVLMDYVLPDGSGADATRIVKQRSPRTRVIVLTGLTDDEHLLNSVHAGADGYLTKTRTLADVVAAVRAAHAGEMLLPASVIAHIAHVVAASGPRDTAASAMTLLTPSETRVLGLLASGSGSADICAALAISRSTLRSHVDHILDKLGARSRIQAVTIALADPDVRAALLAARRTTPARAADDPGS